MKEHDATETAYKNGYNQGKIDATEHVKVRLKKLYDEMIYDAFYHNCPLTERNIKSIQDILNDMMGKQLCE